MDTAINTHPGVAFTAAYTARKCEEENQAVEDLLPLLMLNGEVLVQDPSDTEAAFATKVTLQQVSELMLEDWEAAMEVNQLLLKGQELHAKVLNRELMEKAAKELLLTAVSESRG